MVLPPQSLTLLLDQPHCSLFLCIFTTFFNIEVTLHSASDHCKAISFLGCWTTWLSEVSSNLNYYFCPQAQKSPLHTSSLWFCMLDDWLKLLSLLFISSSSSCQISELGGWQMWSWWECQLSCPKKVNNVLLSHPISGKFFLLNIYLFVLPLLLHNFCDSFFPVRSWTRCRHFLFRGLK